MNDARFPCQAAHRKMLDALNSVGLSDSLLRMIDRRQRTDKWITYGGMVRRLYTRLQFPKPQFIDMLCS